MAHKINANDILGKPPAMLSSRKYTLDQKYEQFETIIPGPSHKAIVREMKTHIPDTYRKFFPKIYSGVDRFFDWRLSSSIEASVFSYVLMNQENIEGYQAFTNMAMLTLLHQKYEMPIFFVEPELLDAVIKSKVLTDDFNFSNLKLPFSAMTFIFPRNSLELLPAFRDKTIQYISIAKIDKGDIQTDLGKIVRPMSEESSLVVATGFSDNTFFAPRFILRALGNVLKMSDEEFYQISHRVTEANFSLDETSFVTSLLRLAIGLVLVMEARQDLITPEKRIRAIKTFSKNRAELWAPNIIGSKYRLSQQRSNNSNTSGFQKRIHWRRGHFRHQGYGKRLTHLCSSCGHKQNNHIESALNCEFFDCLCTKFSSHNALFENYKTIWLEPVLVGGANEQ